MYLASRSIILIEKNFTEEIVGAVVLVSGDKYIHGQHGICTLLVITGNCTEVLLCLWELSTMTEFANRR